MHSPCSTISQRRLDSTIRKIKSLENMASISRFISTVVIDTRASCRPEMETMQNGMWMAALICGQYLWRWRMRESLYIFWTGGCRLVSVHSWYDTFVFVVFNHLYTDAASLRTISQKAAEREWKVQTWSHAYSSGPERCKGQYHRL